MEDRELFESFLFRLYSFSFKHDTDNSRGVSHHYIGYLYRGSARLVSEEGTLELKAGDLFYIPKGCRYRSYWEGDSEIRFDSFAFDAFPRAEGVDYCLQKIPMTEEVGRLHRALAQERKVNLLSVSILYQLLWNVMPVLKQSPYNKQNALAHKIANYIHHHPNERSDKVARQLGISESTMYHVLKQKLNKTPNLLRQEELCQQAINLLTCTDLSVEQVSIQLGFSSASYMRKLLYGYTGKTPLQIRKSAQEI